MLPRWLASTHERTDDLRRTLASFDGRSLVQPDGFESVVATFQKLSKQSELLQLRLREDEALKDGTPVLSTLEATCRALGDVVCKRYDAGMNTSDGGVVASVLELQAHCEQAAAALTLEREEKRRLQQLVDAAAGGELHNVFKQAQAHAEKQVLARMLSSNLEL